MKIRVLGSAAGGGLPQWNCGGEYSRRARMQDSQVPPRTQPSIAVSADGARWSVVNASPDIRMQFAAFPGLHPKAGTREAPLDKIILTNADLDHVMGLLVLREALPYRVITTRWIRDALLQHNAAFRLMESVFDTVELGEAFALDNAGEIQAQFFATPGKAPTYLQKHVSNSPESTLGLRAVQKSAAGELAYAPGIARYDEATIRALSAATLRFVDGTFWGAEELLQLRPGAPDAWRMGHAPIGGEQGTLLHLQKMPGRSYYIHINNTNPILDAQSKERAQVHAAGVGVAHDGLELEL